MLTFESEKYLLILLSNEVFLITETNEIDLRFTYLSAIIVQIKTFNVNVVSNVEVFCFFSF